MAIITHASAFLFFVICMPACTLANSVSSFTHAGYEEELQDPAEILDEILPYIKMAREAYQDNKMSDSIEMVARSKLIRGSRRADTEVHVCILHDKSVVFAFRGTETRNVGSFIKDWLTDVDAVEQDVDVLQPSSDMKAHRGFQAALKEVTEGKENLVSVLQELGMEAGEVERVVCVGHSLGGALATLCAKWCRDVAFPHAEIGCVTIGSPRVGNEAFAADFEKRVVSKGGGLSYRVVNKRDVVPWLPWYVRDRTGP